MPAGDHGETGGAGPVYNNQLEFINTPNIKEAEVRLVQGRCEWLYTSPSAEERSKAESALIQLSLVRRQKTRARPASAPTLSASAITYRNRNQRAAQRFAEVDIDSNQQLNFEEFCTLIPRAVRDVHGVGKMREWFDEADVDGDDSLSTNEYFVWTLSNARASGGPSPLRRACEKFDQNRNGSLEFSEFEALCESVGYGPYALEIFRSLDRVGRVHDGHFLYTDLEAVVLRHGADGELSTRAKEMLSGLVLSQAETELSVEAKAQLDARAASWSIRAQDPAGVLSELRALLASSGFLVVDLMRLFDQDDRALFIDGMEFQAALKANFGCRAPPWILDKVFDMLDSDGTGYIGFDELFEFVRGHRHARDHRSLKVRKLRLRPPHGAAWVLTDLAWDVETLRTQVSKEVSK